MADYRWQDFQTDRFEDRFTSVPWIVGRDIWLRGMLAFPFATVLEAHEWVNDIRRAAGGQPPPACPRVFISHRQIDDTWARRIAWLAWDCPFNHWLDVIDLDPTRNRQVQLLEARLGRPLLDHENGILTAAIIEMALLNCTHLLAVMTNNTAGSQWVPYEYGRVKEPPPLALESSCWWDSTTLSGFGIPEYMYLGPILADEAAIRFWLRGERSRYSNCFGTVRDAEPQWSARVPTG
jgi:hypothetical protein